MHGPLSHAKSTMKPESQRGRATRWLAACESESTNRCFHSQLSRASLASCTLPTVSSSLLCLIPPPFFHQLLPSLTPTATVLHPTPYQSSLAHACVGPRRLTTTGRHQRRTALTFAYSASGRDGLNLSLPLARAALLMLHCACG